MKTSNELIQDTTVNQKHDFTNFSADTDSNAGGSRFCIADDSSHKHGDLRIIGLRIKLESDSSHSTNKDGTKSERISPPCGNFEKEDGVVKEPVIELRGCRLDEMRHRTLEQASQTADLPQMQPMMQLSLSPHFQDSKDIEIRIKHQASGERTSPHQSDLLECPSCCSTRVSFDSCQNGSSFTTLDAERHQDGPEDASARFDDGIATLSSRKAEVELQTVGASGGTKATETSDLCPKQCKGSMTEALQSKEANSQTVEGKQARSSQTDADAKKDGWTEVEKNWSASSSVHCLSHPKNENNASDDTSETSTTKHSSCIAADSHYASRPRIKGMNLPDIPDAACGCPHPNLASNGRCFQPAANKKENHQSRKSKILLRPELQSRRNPLLRNKKAPNVKRSLKLSLNGSRKRPLSQAKAVSFSTIFKSDVAETMFLPVSKRLMINQMLRRPLLQVTINPVGVHFLGGQNVHYGQSTTETFSRRRTNTEENSERFDYDCLKHDENIKDRKPLVTTSTRRDFDLACEKLKDLLLRGKSETDSSSAASTAKVVQSTWFSVASRKDSNLKVVKDYLKWFEKFSNSLLKALLFSTDENGNNVLHFAFFQNRFDLADEFLKNIVAKDLLNEENRAGYSSLMVCSASNPKTDFDWRVVRKSFQMGGVNGMTPNSQTTPLMIAASLDSHEMVRLLLDLGADPNLQDKDGSTPLMYAAQHGCPGSAQVLASHRKCDPSIEDEDGEKACSIALRAGQKDVAVIIHMLSLKMKKLRHFYSSRTKLSERIQNVTIKARN